MDAETNARMAADHVDYAEVKELEAQFNSGGISFCSSLVKSGSRAPFIYKDKLIVCKATEQCFLRTFVSTRLVIFALSVIWGC